MTEMTRVLLLATTLCSLALPAWADDCRRGAADDCLLAMQVSQAQGTLRYYASLAAGQGAPTDALVAVHGYPHDANRTFDAALLAARGAEALDRTLVVAPLFQVDPGEAPNCHTAGVPSAQPGDLLWTCSSWMEGGLARGADGLGSFDAMDALVAEVHRQWPSVTTVTVAGFSAGAQMVQHGIGFAKVPPPGIALRYVVADPGTWLYFDPGRPAPSARCGDTNRWKYGTDDVPAHLQRTGTQARARYAEAEVHYLEGELDTGVGRGTAARVLDHSCAADAQGPYRLERGLAYAAYDRSQLAPLARREVTVVPGCAHDVACVFPSVAARAALFKAP